MHVRKAVKLGDPGNLKPNNPLPGRTRTTRIASVARGDGGAIAIGHPLGATGARITGKAASLLAREGKQFALATQCIGGGQGIATILEAV